MRHCLAFAQYINICMCKCLLTSLLREVLDVDSGVVAVLEGDGGVPVLRQDSSPRI